MSRLQFSGITVLAPGGHEGVVLQAGTSFAYKFVAQDAEQTLLTYSLANGAPEGMLINPQTGEVTWTPEVGTTGWYPVSIVAEDGAGGRGELSFTFRVEPSVHNFPPIITSQPATVVRFGDVYRTLVDVLDPNGDPLSFSLIQAPAGMTLERRDSPASNEGASAALSWTPSPGQLGSHNVTVQVTDGHSAPVTQTFTVNVLGLRENSSPVISSTPALVAVVGRTYAYDVVATDADHDALLYRAGTNTVAPDGVTAQPGLPIGASLNSLRGTVRWTPTVDQIGLQRVAVDVMDGVGGMVHQEWVVRVQGVNQPPIFTSSPLTEAAINVPYTYAVKVKDGEGDKIRFSVETALPNVMIDPYSGVLEWLPRAVNSTPQTVTIVAEDGFGGVARQTYGLVVLATPANQPPVITTAPVKGVSPGETYTQPFTGTDPEGGALSWSLSQAPAGMTIASGTGALTWTTSTGDTGTHNITVVLTDAAGASTSLNYTLNVSVNQVPILGTVPPVTTGITGTSYTSWLDVTDTNSDVLTYRVVDGPPGLTIDSTGHLHWTVPAEPGTYNVTVAANDGRGGEVTQTFTLTTVTDSTLPVISLVAEYDVRKLGEPNRFQARATDNDKLVDLVLTVDGTAVPLNQFGIAAVTMDRSGFVPIVATARDRSGNVATSTLTIRVINPADQSFPVVSIDSAPLEAAAGVISTATQITGNVNDDALEYWRMDIAPLDLIDSTQPAADNPAYRVLGNGTTNIAHQPTGRVDPTTLANGSYYLRLIAGDSNGNITAKGFIVTIACDLKLGRLLLPVTDLSIPVAGIPITVTRVYDSLEASRSSDFGYGWSLAVQNPRIQESVPADPGERNGLPAFFGGPTFDYGTRITLNAPDGRRIGFTFKPKLRDLGIPGYPPGSGLFGTVLEPYFQPDAGNYYKLTGDDDALQMQGSRVTQYLTGFSYNPREYKLTAKDGTVYRYDQYDGLLDITNRNGNVLTFTHTGIKTSSGVEVKFVRDAADRIIEIIDPAGQSIYYAYNVQGELQKITDQSGRSMSFSSVEITHRLNQILDSAGHPIAITNYDGNGRLSTVADALGHVTTIVYDEATHTETKTDPLGGVTVSTFDIRGNLLKNVNPVGSISLSVYDNNNNVVNITPPCGCTKTYTYDANGNQISVIDANGSINSSKYDAYNKVISSTDANGNTTNFTYNIKGLPSTFVDALGNVTKIDSDEYGRPVSLTDPVGRVTKYFYEEGNGNNYTSNQKPSYILFPDNTYYQYTYNSLGVLTSFTDASGALKQFVCDNAGKLIREINPLGQQTRYSYNNRGQIESITNALEQVTLSEYDLNGRLIHRKDPNGATTTWAWDPLGRLSSTTDPLNRTTRKFYRPDNALEKIQQPDGTFIIFDNDSNGRRIAVGDPNGNVTYFTWNSANQITSQRDALGYLTIPLYDKAGNIVSITDRLGRTRKFNYDARNRFTDEIWLEAETQKIQKHIKIAYDAIGNAVEGSDDISKFLVTYDYRNRPIISSVKYSSMPYSDVFTLSNAYNDVSRHYRTIDSDGISVEHQLDSRAQLQSVTWQGPGSFAPARVDFTRNILGDVINIARFTDIAGMHAAVNTAITFGRSKADNGIFPSLYNNSGDSGETSASFKDTDSFGPLSLGMDTQSLRQQSSGSDPLRRISQIIHTGNMGSVLAEYQYTHDNAGQLKISSYSGDVITYDYDLTGQVLGSSKRFQNSTSESFVYDASGNRTSSLQGAVGKPYSVGRNNHILSDGNYSYKYDAEGNLIEKLDSFNGEKIAYSYDHRNRLVAIIKHSSLDEVTQTILYTYDIANRRIAKNINNDTTQYLYNGDHIWREISTSMKDTYYLVGENTDQWLARQSSYPNSGGLFWYLTDRLGSVKAIASSDGEHLLTENDYSVYGKVLSQSNPALADQFGFAGREHDKESGLIFCRGRYYNPECGIFISEDPMGFQAGDFLLNRYAVNAPTNYTDPFGTNAEKETKAIKWAFIDRVSLGVVIGAGALVGTMLCVIDAVQWQKTAVRWYPNNHLLEATLLSLEAAAAFFVAFSSTYAMSAPPPMIVIGGLFVATVMAVKGTTCTGQSWSTAGAPKN
ncbi:MAG: putative Ig domain-containing protein [Candidatus Methylacidiphilales bacterium]